MAEITSIYGNPIRDKSTYSKTESDERYLQTANVDTELDNQSHNPVENAAITEAIDDIIDDMTVTKTASGNLIHITDAAALPAEECVTTLEPVQDLHGYDKPWPAGGNKNILKDGETSPISAKGFTATMNSDGSWNIGGGTTDSFFSTIYSNLPINFPAGTYTFSVSCSSDAVINGLQVWIYTMIDGAGIATATRLAIPASVTFTASSSFSITNVAFWHDGTNKSFSGKVFMQLEEASSPTAWTPYSNECPINGHTGVELTRTGKNLLPNNATSTTVDGVQFVVSDDGRITATGTSTGWTGLSIGTCTLEAGTWYLRSYVETDYAKCYLEAVGGGSTYNTYANPSKQIVLSKTTTLTVELYVPSGQTVSNVTCSPMIYKADGSIPTYEPYTPETHTITFPQAQSPVYGCEVDWVNGVLRVTEVNVDLGTLTWAQNSTPYGYRYYADTNPIGLQCDTSHNLAICSIYPLLNAGETATSKTGFTISADAKIFIHDGVIQDESAETFAQRLSGQTICYPLATPLEIALTPEVITLLKGENNIWLDAGTFEKFEYYPDSTIGEQIGELDNRVTDLELSIQALQAIGLTIVNGQLCQTYTE